MKLPLQNDKNKCLWDAKARAYRDLSAREHTLNILADLFEILTANCQLRRIGLFNRSILFAITVN